MVGAGFFGVGDGVGARMPAEESLEEEALEEALPITGEIVTSGLDVEVFGVLTVGVEVKGVGVFLTVVFGVGVADAGSGVVSGARVSLGVFVDLVGVGVGVSDVSAAKPNDSADRRPWHVELCARSTRPSSAKRLLDQVGAIVSSETPGRVSEMGSEGPFGLKDGRRGRCECRARGEDVVEEWHLGSSFRVTRDAQRLVHGKRNKHTATGIGVSVCEAPRGLCILEGATSKTIWCYHIRHLYYQIP